MVVVVAAAAAVVDDATTQDNSNRLGAVAEDLSAKEKPSKSAPILIVTYLP